MYKLEIYNGDVRTGSMEFRSQKMLGDGMQALAPTILQDGVTIEVSTNE